VPRIRPATPALLLAVGVLAAATIAYELLLIRLFALVHWHHMVGVAIGLALLGYGASGTFVAVVGDRLQRHFNAAFVVNASAFSVGVPLCVAAAQSVTFDPQSVFWELWPIGLLAASFLILAVPFFAAANCIALSLMRYADQIPRIYGIDLIGAGTGAVLLVLLLSLLHPIQALYGVAATGLVAALLGAVHGRWRRLPVLTFCIALCAAWLMLEPVEVRPAAYKDLARALSVAGAEPVDSLTGINGVVDVIDNRIVRFREAPGLSLASTVELPHQLGVFVDGDAAGVIDLRRDNAAGAEYLAHLLSAVPYQLSEPARVAVLNAGVGRGVAQALALGARQVTAVESNPLLATLACERFATSDPRRCERTHVSWHIGAARTFGATDPMPFDLVMLQATGDDAGLDALQIDFDLTREAVESYLGMLAPGGLLAIEGRIRVPPRQSIRLLATAREAILASGASAPGERLALLRGWQRYLLLVFERPIDPPLSARLRTLAESGGFDLAWLPGIRPEEVNRFQRLASPVYFDAARAMLAPGPPGDPPLRPLTVRPATDDRPFPHRFSAWSELPAAIRSPGTRVDAALLIAPVLLLLAVLASVLLILLPLATLRWRHPKTRPTGSNRPLRWAVFGYFGLVGLAFLAIEVAWILALELFLDEPVYAAAIVLGGFLVFAGLGSLFAQRLPEERAGLTLGLATTAIVAGGALYLLWVHDWLATIAPLGFGWKAPIAVGLLAPLAFAMGIPFPVGLRAFGARSQTLIPWAWGINGCASVISAVGAPLVAVEFGYSGLLGAALAAYVAATVIFVAHEKHRGDTAA
jgi:hypothetical protein